MKEIKNSIPIIISAILIMATFITYEPIRHNNFVNIDDNSYIVKNEMVNKGFTSQSFLWAFKSFKNANWHPITWFSHMLDCQLFGLNPTGHHLVNVAIHIANTLLLFWILYITTGSVWRSSIVAALFALHPVHVESVAWASERKDVLSSFLGLLATLAYVKYVRHISISRYLLVILLFALALMAKPMLVTLPFVFLLLDYWPLNRMRTSINLPNAVRSHLSNEKLAFPKLVLEKIPLIIMSAFSSIITVIAQHKGGAIYSTEEYSIAIRMANAVVSYIEYILKMLYPSQLAVIYPHPQKLPLGEVLLCFIVLVFITIIVLKAKNKPYLFTGWFWFIGTLVPVIGLIQVGGQAMADRYTYIPSIGFFLMIVWLLGEFYQKSESVKIFIKIVSAIIFLIFIIRTQIQVTYWKNSFSLYSYTLEVTKNNYIINNNYAATLMDMGDYEKALKFADEALQIKPNHLNAMKNKGFILLKKGRYTEAMPIFKEILKYEPNCSAAFYGIGKINLQDKKLKDAIEYLEKATVFPPPNTADVYHNLGVAYYESGNFKEAVKNWQKTLEVDPNAVGTLNNLAWLMATVEDANIRNYDKAIEFSKKACELTRYEQPSMLNTLASCYASAGKFDLAAKTAKKALKLTKSGRDEVLIKDIEEKLKSYQTKINSQKQ